MEAENLIYNIRQEITLLGTDWYDVLKSSESQNSCLLIFSKINFVGQINKCSVKTSKRKWWYAFSAKSIFEL
jgi:hypothetical protein